MTVPTIGSMPIARALTMLSAYVIQWTPNSIDEVGVQLRAMVQVGAEMVLVDSFADVGALHEVNLVCIDGVGVVLHDLCGDDFRALDAVEKGLAFMCNMAGVGRRVRHGTTTPIDENFLLARCLTKTVTDQSSNPHELPLR